MRNAPRSILFVLMAVPFAGCGLPDGEQPDKPPLIFDDSSVLYPPPIEVTTSTVRRNQQPVDGLALQPRALPLDLATYHVFGIGSGISGNDLTFLQKPGGAGIDINFTAAGNSFLEATYSSRLASTPEKLWAPSGVWMQAAAMLDSEQTEIHFNWQMTPGYYQVDLDWAVNSELNYDYLWINSTSFANCNKPGIVHHKVSGINQSGSASFQIPGDCGRGWVGIYYIKDGSVTAPGEYARIKNVRIQRLIPVGTR
jgi:hypothetical protein